MFRKHGAHFERHKLAFEEGGGRDDAIIEDQEKSSKKSSHDGDSSLEEKHQELRVD